MTPIAPSLDQQSGRLAWPSRDQRWRHNWWSWRTSMRQCISFEVGESLPRGVDATGDDNPLVRAVDDHVVYAGDTGDPLQVVQGAFAVTHRGGVLAEVDRGRPRPTRSRQPAPVRRESSSRGTGSAELSAVPLPRSGVAGLLPTERATIHPGAESRGVLAFRGPAGMRELRKVRHVAGRRGDAKRRPDRDSVAVHLGLRFHVPSDHVIRSGHVHGPTRVEVLHAHDGFVHVVETIAQPRPVGHGVSAWVCPSGRQWCPRRAVQRPLGQRPRAPPRLRRP